MPIRKRGNIWHIDVTVGTERVQRSAGTTERAQAQELHDKIKAELWRRVKLGETPAFTWADAVKLYLSERQHLRQLDRVIVPQIEWLAHRIPDATPLTEIKGDMITRLRLDRATTPTRKGTLPKQATINYPLAILSAILNLAHKHGMVAAVPHIELPNPQNERVRWITQQEANTLLAATDDPAFRALVEFSLEMGFRQDNAVSLRWAWIDLPNRSITIPAAEFKGKRSHTQALSDRAMALLLAQRGRGEGFVFLNAKGRRYTHSNDTLRAVCAKVGIEDFHWHDLRHTWATWHVRAGTPLEVLQKLGGWRDYRTVLRYAVFAQDHLATYANQVRRDIPVTQSKNVIGFPGATGT